MCGGSVCCIVCFVVVKFKRIGNHAGTNFESQHCKLRSLKLPTGTIQTSGYQYQYPYCIIIEFKTNTYTHI